MTRPIFDYPKDWEISNLMPSPENEIIESASSGSTPFTAILKYWGGTLPWLTPKQITGRNTFRYKYTTERFLTKDGLKKAGRTYPINTVMLTKRAPVGYVVINKTPMCTNQGFLNFKCGKKLVPEFLLYWFKANKPYLDRIANGSTFDELYPYDLFEFKIGIPEINEQKKIVKKLDSIEDKIYSNLKLIKILHSSLSTLYKNWSPNNNQKNSKKIPFNEISKLQKGFSLQRQ